MIIIYLIANVYRPPRGKIENFINLLTAQIDLLDTFRSKELHIMGDMNIDLLTNDADTKTMHKFIKLIGCQQLVTKPTRTNEKTSTLLDLVITNSDHIVNVGNKTLNISDHDMIYITRKMILEKRQPITFTGRSYRNFDPKDFQRYLTEADWEDFWETIDPNTAWEKYESYIVNYLDKNCPVKIFKFGKQKSPWISDSLIKYLKEKDYLLAKAKRTHNSDDWQIAVYHRNRAKRFVKEEKREYYMKLLDDNRKESKTYWKSVNSLFKPKDSSEKFHLVDQVSKTQIAPEETADYINDFFVNIGPKLARDYTRPWKPPSNTVPQTFELLPVEVNTVSKVAKDLNSSKASAIENISSPVLKEAFLHTPNQFTHIINLSLTTGKVPEKWKVATVVPLPKEGDP